MIKMQIAINKEVEVHSSPPSPRTFLWLEPRDCARGSSQLEQRQREAHIQCAAGEREHSWPSLEGDTDSGMQLLGTGSMLTTPTWIPMFSHGALTFSCR